MPLEDDKNGFDFWCDAMSRKNKKFTGHLLDGIPFIGILTYYDNGDGKEYTELGRYNKLT